MSPPTHTIQFNTQIATVTAHYIDMIVRETCLATIYALIQIILNLLLSNSQHFMYSEWNSMREQRYGSYVCGYYRIVDIKLELEIQLMKVIDFAVLFYPWNRKNYLIEKKVHKASFEKFSNYKAQKKWFLVEIVDWKMWNYIQFYYPLQSTQALAYHWI